MKQLDNRCKIVVIGGGFAGMFAAKRLEQKIGWRADIELINETNYFVFQPLLPEVAAGSITTREAVSPLRRLLPGVKLRQAKVFDVDIERKTVIIFQGQRKRQTEVKYDHLIIAVGQSVDLSRYPGMEEHALCMKTLNDAHRVRNHVIEKLEHADITNIPEIKNQLLTFTVVGGGFAGSETVGEIRDLIDHSLPYYSNIDASEVRVLLLEYSDHILGELPRTLSLYAKKYFQVKRNIEVHLNTGIASATATQVLTTNGELIDTQTIVATIGNGPSPLIKKLGMPHENGRIRTTRELKVEGYKDVWSLGDSALIPLVDHPTEREDFAPATAQFAVQEAKLLSRNIEAELSNEPLLPFHYKSRGALASLGGERGVAEIFGFKFRGFLAWLLWRGYYLSIAPGFATKMRIAASWILDHALGRNTVQSGISHINSMRHVRYRKDDIVFEPGNRADGLYVVKSGSFEMRLSECPEPAHKIDVGDHFGGQALMDGHLRISTVRALEDSEVLVMNGGAFIELINVLPPLRDHFQAYLDKVSKYPVYLDSEKEARDA